MKIGVLFEILLSTKILDKGFMIALKASNIGLGNHIFNKFVANINAFVQLNETGYYDRSDYHVVHRKSIYSPLFTLPVVLMTTIQ